MENILLDIVFLVLADFQFFDLAYVICGLGLGLDIELYKNSLQPLLLIKYNVYLNKEVI